MTASAQQPSGVSSWEKAIREVAPFMCLKHVDLGELQDSALSILFRQDSYFGVHYYNKRDQNIYTFRSSVAAYLLLRGQAIYPKYEPLRRKDVSCTSVVTLYKAAAT